MKRSRMMVLVAVLAAAGACKKEGVTKKADDGRIPIPNFSDPRNLAEKWDFLGYKPDPKLPSLHRNRPIFTWIFVEEKDGEWSEPIDIDITQLAGLPRNPGRPYALLTWQGSFDTYQMFKCGARGCGTCAYGSGCPPQPKVPIKPPKIMSEPNLRKILERTPVLLQPDAGVQNP